MEQCNNQIRELRVLANEITEMLRKHNQLTDTVVKIVTEEQRQGARSRILGWLVRRFRVDYPRCLWRYATHPYLRTAYAVAVGIQRAGTTAKLTSWLFDGGCPWEWTMDWCLGFALMGYWGKHVILFMAGHRDVSFTFRLLLMFFGITTWRRVFPNWWDHRWELSFVMPAGLLCYLAWHHWGIGDHVRGLCSRRQVFT